MAHEEYARESTRNLGQIKSEMRFALGHIIQNDTYMDDSGRLHLATIDNAISMIVSILLPFYRTLR